MKNRASLLGWFLLLLFLLLVIGSGKGIGATPALADAGNLVAPQAPGTCLTAAHPCLAVPVTIARGTPDALMAFSVTLQLSANLALCDSGVVEGPYLAGAGQTSFQLRDRGAGLYTVDDAILGDPCGATAPGGTLFTLKLASSAPSGTGTVTLTGLILRDCDNHPVAGSLGPPAALTIDNSGPARITALAATQLRSGNDHDGTTKITVSWPARAAGDTVRVYRAGYGHYPEYDDPPGAGAVPATPTYPPRPPWTLAGIVPGGASLVDEVATRDFWYYVAFVRDACGLLSPVSNKTSGTLNYFLGDVHDGSRNCAGNNAVSTEDLSFLGAHYGAILGAADSLACLDVGPTTDNSVNTLPLTDNSLDFEDLLVFALNWRLVSAPQDAAAPAPLAAGSDGLWLEAPARVAAGESFTVALRARGAGDLQGVSAQLGWDAGVAEPVAVEAGALLAGQDGVVLRARPGDVGAVLLGAGRGIAGEGVLATVSFRARASGDPKVTLAAVDARDGANRKVALATGGPAAAETTTLAPARPNPFRQATTLAFTLARAGTVGLAVYGVDGRRVATLLSGARAAGAYRLDWDGRDGDGRPVRPGMYYARLTTPEGRFTRTLVLMR